jgi:hypothetical protein
MFLALEGDLKGLRRDLDKAQKMAKDAGSKGGKNFGGQFAGATDKLSALTGVVGAVEAGFKVADVAVKLFNGDIKGAAEGLKQLPFGIGAAASAMEGFLGSITGISSELKEIEKSTKKMNKAFAQGEQVKALTNRLGQEAELAGKSEIEREGILRGRAKDQTSIIKVVRIQKSALANIDKVFDERMKKILARNASKGGGGGGSLGGPSSTTASLSRTSFLRGGDPESEARRKSVNFLEQIATNTKKGQPATAQ